MRQPVRMTEQGVNAALAAGGQHQTPSLQDEFGIIPDDESAKSSVRVEEECTLMEVDHNEDDDGYGDFMSAPSAVTDATLTLGSMYLSEAARGTPQAMPQPHPDIVAMPPPPRPDTGSGIKLRSGKTKAATKEESSDSDSGEESQESFNSKWPVTFTDACMSKDPYGRCANMDAGTISSISSHLSDDEYMNLPPGCFDTYISL